MKHIALTAIDFDSATQLRAEINTETVTEYAERMKEGDKFPPVDLFQIGDRYLIGDGWHRLLAYQKNGDVTVGAEIHSGGRTEAIRFALGANAKHGMARSNADKRKAVEVALREFPNLSNREVGKACGVSYGLVHKIRAEEQLLTVNSSPEPETRIGADGKERRMPTRKETIPTMPEEEEEMKAKPEPTTRLPRATVDAARGIWLLAKSQLDKIGPKDLSREAVLREVIGYAQDRLDNHK